MSLAIDLQIDAFVADLDASLCIEATTDLLWGELQAQARFDALQNLGTERSCIAAVSRALSTAGRSSLSTVVPLLLAASRNLTFDRAAVSPKLASNGCGVYRLAEQRFQLVSFVQVQVFVLGHGASERFDRSF